MLLNSYQQQSGERTYFTLRGWWLQEKAHFKIKAQVQRLNNHPERKIKSRREIIKEVVAKINNHMTGTCHFTVDS